MRTATVLVPSGCAYVTPARAASRFAPTRTLKPRAVSLTATVAFRPGTTVNLCVPSVTITWLRAEPTRRPRTVVESVRTPWQRTAFPHRSLTNATRTCVTRTERETIASKALGPPKPTT